MAFTVKGRWRSQIWEVTWDKGELSGDLVAVTLIEGFARGLHNQLVGPVAGPYTVTAKAHLRSPLSAFFIMIRFFDELVEVKGDVPSAPRVPHGAVA